MADTDYDQVLKAFQDQRKRRTEKRSLLGQWIFGMQPGGMGMQHQRGAEEWGLGIAERYDDPTMPAKVLGTAMPAGIFDLAGMAQQGGEMLITGETGNLPGRISGDPLRRAIGYDPEDPQALMGEIAGPDVLTAGIKGLVAAGKLGHSMLASAPWLATKLKQLNKGGFFSDSALLNAVKEAGGNSRTAIVEMTPNQFLAMAEKSKRNEAKMEGIQEVLNRGEGMESTPFMYVDMREADDGSLIADVTGHEGRHRARTLIEQGLGDEPMPVRIISREGGDVGAIRWSNDPRRPTEMVAEGGRQLEETGLRLESDRMPFPKVLGDQAAGEATYSGPAFRYEPGFEGGAPPGSTVGDVLAEEMSRKGVDDLEGFGIDPATYESIKDLPADAVTWVGRDANRMMQEYGPTDDWAGLLSSPDELSDVTDQVAGGRILYEDESGALILRPDAPPSKGTLGAQFLGRDDKFWGIGEDAYGQAQFRKSGHSPVSCTGYACEIQEKLGKERVTVMGFDGESNPGSAISEIADGHDFAVVDGRYIVDPWVTDVEDIGKGAYDMTDPADAAEIRRLYGDPKTWERAGPDAPAFKMTRLPVGEMKYPWAGRQWDVAPAGQADLALNPGREDVVKAFGDRDVRFMVDDMQNLYVWPSDQALHGQVLDALKINRDEVELYSDQIVPASELYDWLDHWDDAGEFGPGPHQSWRPKTLETVGQGAPTSPAPKFTAAGGNKIIDRSTGEPLTVFHASHKPRDFTQNYSDRDVFIHFSAKPRNAEFGKVTTQANIRMRNPLDAEHFAMSERDADAILVELSDQRLTRLVEDAAASDSAIADDLAYTGDHYETMRNWLTGDLSNPSPLPYRELKPEIQRAGYDGIIGTDPFGESREYIVFDTSQINAITAGTPASPIPDDVMSTLQSNIDALGPARASQFTIADLNRAQQIYDPAHAAAEPQSRRMVDIAKDLQKEALQAWGGSPMEFTPENASIVADNMTKEAIESLKHRPDMAGWYKGNLSEAMGHASSIYPELATDPHAETAFKLIMAITSNGKEVEENAKITNRLYQQYRKTGQFPIFGSGKEKGAMEKAFRLANKLVDEWGFDEFTTFLNKEFTVRELKEEGFNVSGELMDTVLNGSVIFGPKVGGGFFQNLTGNYNPATFDLWWTRTFGRHTATALHPEAKIAKQRAALREAIGRKRKFIEDLGFDPKAIKTDDEQLDELARVLNAKFAAGGHKDKNPINNASRNLMTSVGKTREAPAGGGERNFMRDVIGQIQKNLSGAGIDLDIADIQALLWYTEQDLYLKMGGKVDTTKKDYATVWKEIAEAYRAGQ